MSQFEHVIITRFNLIKDQWSTDRQGHQVGSREWFDHRMALFRKFCFPSIYNQSNQNFKWLVFFDQSTSEEYCTLINGMRGFTNFIPIYSTDEEFSTRLGCIVQEHIDRTTEYLITTRIDNDDALRGDAIEFIQGQFCNQDFAFYNLVVGSAFDMRTGAVRTFKSHSNPFISLVERRGTKGYQTVFCDHHPNLESHGQIFDVGEQPLWLRVVHDRNLRNRMPLGKREGLEQLELFHVDRDVIDAYHRMVSENREELEARIHFYDGLELMYDQKFDAAEGCFISAIQHDPELIEAHVNLATVLSNKGRDTLAVTTLERVVDRHPNSIDALSYLGRLYLRSNSRTKAMQCFDRILEMSPDHEIARQHRDRLTITTVPKPNNEHLGERLTQLYQEGNYSEVPVLVERMLHECPNSAELYHHAGAAHAHLGQLVEAENCFRSALEINPKFFPSVYNLGYLATLRADVIRAHECYAQGMAIRGSHVRQIESERSLVFVDSDYGIVQKVLKKHQEIVFDREVMWLNKMADLTFVPKILGYNRDRSSIVMTYCGEQVRQASLPLDWSHQMTDILRGLDSRRCCHNDIKPHDILVKGDRLYLIDFGWATEHGESLPGDWPESIGGSFRSVGERSDLRSFELSIKVVHSQHILEDTLSKIRELAQSRPQLDTGIKRGVVYHPNPFRFFSGITIDRPTTMKRYELVTDHIGSLKGKRLLDLGVGPHSFNYFGYWPFCWASFDADLIVTYDGDIQTLQIEQQLQKLQEVANIQFRPKFFEHSDLRDYEEAEFDIVCALEVFHELSLKGDSQSAQELLSDLARVTKTFYLKVPFAHAQRVLWYANQVGFSVVEELRDGATDSCIFYCVVGSKL